jgi:hypothetical protein
MNTSNGSNAVWVLVAVLQNCMVVVIYEYMPTTKLCECLYKHIHESVNYERIVYIHVYTSYS